MTNASAEVTDFDLNDFTKVHRKVRFCSKLFKDLKGRFHREYLRLLDQKRSKPVSHKMKVVEIVIVENPNKMLYWPLAKVLELLPRWDGKARSLRLKCGKREEEKISPEELPIAAVGMQKVPESSTKSEVPVAYTDQE
ncbi:hypothetical protein TNIN_215841 [Trichonephila inaurata madagascariensis]|uniref:DUF5641 domain-containing protein n=1 Tax=Trichonephila inaurata madagascariensis TaxID=2747483 RepID=A0A8X7CB63_9ARAC|nr:hypothetical protein TNIN_215841 [Trichonephila inaurata madagascariensis]